MSNFGGNQFSSFGGHWSSAGKMSAAPDQVFLLDPANRAFLDKQSDRPAFVPANSVSGMARTTAGCAWIAYLPALGIALVILWLLIGPKVLPRVVDRYGVPANATITDTFEINDVYGNLTGHGITYTFQPGRDQAVYTAKATIPDDVWKTLTKGQTIAIHFLQVDPYLNHVDAVGILPFSLQPSDVLPFVIVGAVLLVIVVLIRAGMRSAANTTQLLQRLLPQMQTVPGEVIEASSQLDNDSYFVLILTYRYFSPTLGTDTATGTVKKIRHDLRNSPLPAPGTPLALVVFPQPVRVPGYSIDTTQRYEFVL